MKVEESSPKSKLSTIYLSKKQLEASLSISNQTFICDSNGVETKTSVDIVVTHALLEGSIEEARYGKDPVKCPKLHLWFRHDGKMVYFGYGLNVHKKIGATIDPHAPLNQRGDSIQLAEIRASQSPLSPNIKIFLKVL